MILVLLHRINGYGEKLQSDFEQAVSQALFTC